MSMFKRYVWIPFLVQVDYFLRCIEVLLCIRKNPTKLVHLRKTQLQNIIIIKKNG